MITWVNKGISIGAMHFPDRKKPALCIVENNIAQVFGYFNDDECATLFMRTFEELLGVAMPDKYREGDEDK